MLEEQSWAYELIAYVHEIVRPVSKGVLKLSPHYKHLEKELTTLAMDLLEGTPEHTKLADSVFLSCLAQILGRTRVAEWDTFGAFVSFLVAAGEQENDASFGVFSPPDANEYLTSPCRL